MTPVWERGDLYLDLEIPCDLLVMPPSDLVLIRPSKVVVSKPRTARKKALATGASTALVEDLREEFVRDYIWPTLRAGAVYEHTYLLGTSMARPGIAKRQAERDHGVLDARHAADEGVGADPHELMHRREPADAGKIPNLAVAAERGVVDQQDIVAETKPILKSLFVLLMWEDRARVFEAAMRQPRYRGRTWALLQDIAPRGWSSVGGSACWGRRVG